MTSRATRFQIVAFPAGVRTVVGRFVAAKHVPFSEPGTVRLTWSTA
jgi:hypothetical protein